MNTSNALAGFTFIALFFTPAARSQDCAPGWTAKPFQTSEIFAIYPYDIGIGRGFFIGTNHGIWLFQGQSFVQMAEIGTVWRFREIEWAGLRSLYAFSQRGTYRLDGSTWQLIFGESSSDAAVYDDGNGAAFFISTNQFVYRFAGEMPEVVATLQPNYCGPTVLAVWDDGSGEGLFLGGVLDRVNDVPIHGIAKWKGNVWSDVGDGFSFVHSPYPPGCEAGVRDLLVHDDGNGPKLYAGGSFDLAGGQYAVNVAAWDGVQWVAVGSPVEYQIHDEVFRLAAVALPDLTGLLACGRFTRLGGIDAVAVALWNGANWTSPFAGISTYRYFEVSSLAVNSDAHGDAILLGGRDLGTNTGIEPSFSLLEYSCNCADVDGDGQVGIGDLVLVLSNFGLSGLDFNFPGNVDHDANIDIADLSLVLGQFATVCQ